MVKKSKEKEKGKGKAKAVTHQVLDVESVMRKCYPIYDAIDAKNYKLASKLAKAAAAKCPGSNIIKALYGVTLERLGRLDEALEVGREVCKMGDMDDHVVNTLTIIFKAANKLEELTSALEEAAASVSGSSSVTAHLSLFNNCARTFQFLKMQQVAMKLYKKTNNLKYVLFAVTSIYLQSVESGKTQFLFLAENMCKKAASGSRGLMALSEDCGPDALLLYIEVLFSQNKHSEALTLLRSMHGKGTRLLTSQLRMLEVVLCIACKERDAALDILEKHIQCNQEDWHAAKVFMDLSVGTTTPLALPFTQNNVFRQMNMDHVISINPLDKADRFLHQLDLNDHEKESTGFRESGIQRTKALLAKLQETAKDKRKVRAVHLMKLDLLSRQIRLAASEEGTVSARDAMQAELVDSLYDFWSIAGTNISFSSDISDFLTLLSVNSARLFYEKLLGERSKVFEDVTTSAEKGDVSYQTKKKFCQVLSSLEIEVQLIPTLEALSCAQSLSFALDLFVKCKELFKGFDERENTIADPLIVLISKLIWMQQNTNTDKDQDRTTKDTLNVLVNMIIVHQSGVKLSPYNSSMLLSLCLLYGYLGATDLAAEYFWKLDIKYIQLESIGAHMLLPYLSASGNEREALKFCDKLLHFHEDHNRNAGDTFALTFKHGTYLEAVDFAGLRNRLGTSLVRCSVYVERALLKVLQRSPVGLKGIEQIVVNECREVEQALQIEGEDSLLDHFCNQDLSVRPEWAPPFASSALGSLDFWDKKEKELSSSSGNGSGPGSESICWWQTVNAVNRMDEGHKANTLRMNLRRDVVYRYAFLRALGVLLRPEKSDLEACTNMKGFVQLMAKALLGSKEEVTPEEIRRRALEKVEKTSSKLELVALQLFVCSDYLLRFDNEPSEAAAEGFEGSLKEFSKSLAEVEEEMFGDASASTNANGLLCGGKTVTFASAFVRELVSWTTLSLQKWKVLMKQQKVKDASLKALVSRVKSSLEEGITCFRHLLERLDKKLDSHIQLFQESGGEAWEGSPFLQLGCNMPLVSANLAESQLASLKVTCDRLNKYFNLVKALQ